MVEVSVGYLDCVNEDSEIYITTTFADQFSLELPNDLIYDVGIDQSTSCTGITVRPLNQSFIVVMEVLNVNKDPYYIARLKSLIFKLLEGKKVRYFIMEQPLVHATGKRSKLLVNLKKQIQEMSKSLDIEAFREAPVTSWRHGLMPKTIEGSDRRKKETVVEAVLQIYPKLAPFLNVSNHDYDGIESLGILIGYLARHNIRENGSMKIMGQRKTAKKGIALFLQTDEDLNDNNITTAIEMFHNHSKGNFKIKEYNGEETLYSNVKMSLEDDYTFTVLSDPLAELTALIKMGKKPLPGTIVVMFVVKASLVTEVFLKGLFACGFTAVIYK